MDPVVDVAVAGEAVVAWAPGEKLHAARAPAAAKTRKTRMLFRIG